jgi:tRNA-specific 2-thiouridylase
LGVPNWDKPDSQELCFVPDGDIGGFIERERGLTRPGLIRDGTGSVLGSHRGLHHFTVGQRRGLGLGGGPARYVLRVVPETNEVVVGDEDQLLASACSVPVAAWVGDAPAGPFDAQVRIRHRHRPAPARITCDGPGFRVQFASPQRAITPGQAAVVYRDDELVGGGLIA